MNGTMNTKAYIVDEVGFKIITDEIDFDNPIITENHWSNKFSERYCYCFRGKKSNLWPEGRLYLTQNCFKTEKEAKEKLKTIIKYTIEENLILIENLNGENERLNKKLNDIENGQING